MFKKVSKIVFCVCFILMITVPLITINLKKNTVSTAENRTLAQQPSVYTEDGVLNSNFNTEFETWVNDNIGFRSSMVVANARIQYHMFDVLANNSNMYLGPNGEFNYATDEMLRDYQHLNCYADEQLLQIADAYQKLQDYTDKNDTQLYLFQCWDKHSIYPEYFPTTVEQAGELSKTDKVIDAIKNNTSVDVISTKQVLIDGKSNYQTYSKWGDATHWTQRGAYIGYQTLMSAINEKNANQYKVLQEDDYNIALTDQGSTLFGGIHKEDLLENFEIKNPKAVLTNDKLTLYGGIQGHSYYTNDSVSNDTRVLIMGDSYIDSFIIDDIAESFHETIMLWGDYDGDIGNILQTYNPDILVIENAERCDRTSIILGGISALE